jgi:hypothetical protein
VVVEGVVISKLCSLDAELLLLALGQIRVVDELLQEVDMCRHDSQGRWMVIVLRFDVNCVVTT